MDLVVSALPPEAFSPTDSCRRMQVVAQLGVIKTHIKQTHKIKNTTNVRKKKTESYVGHHYWTLKVMEYSFKSAIEAIPIEVSCVKVSSETPADKTIKLRLRIGLVFDPGFKFCLDRRRVSQRVTGPVPRNQTVQGKNIHPPKEVS